jgi:hypothetical protein
VWQGKELEEMENGKVKMENGEGMEFESMSGTSVGAGD